MESFRGPETQVLRAKYRGPETQVMRAKYRGPETQVLRYQFWDLDFTQGASQWPSATATH
jgi:hypothetical protein